MSTEFVSSLTGEVGFVRFGRSAPTGERTSFEFGTMSNFEQVCAEMRCGAEFEPLGGGAMPADPTSVADVERMVASGRVTFGEFPVTVAVGSGEFFRFAVEEG